MLRQQNIIRISEVPWKYLWTRRQIFSKLLAENGNKVLHIEQPGLLLKTSYNKSRNASVTFKDTVTRISSNLQLLTSPTQIPFNKFLRFGIDVPCRLNQVVLGKTILKYQHLLGMESPILWTHFSPSTPIKVFDKIKPKVIVYDCTDNVSGHPNASSILIQMEENLVKKSDVVFVTARGLLPKMLRLNPNTHFVPNGVDFEIFSKIASANSLRCPLELETLLRPVIGYVGLVYDWIRLDLIHTLAVKKPKWSFVMIGPIRCNLRAFSSLKNVHFLGRKPREELPSYLKQFDVCINIFRMNRLTEYVHPLKIYQYLAAGRPVVSVDMPEIRHLDSVVKIAVSDEDFLNLLEESVVKDNEAERQRRMQFAKRYSWENILRIISNKIEEAIYIKGNQR